MTKSLLCSVPESSLEAMFSGRHKLNKQNDKVFLDRDPTLFRLVLNYLRNGKVWPSFEDEAQKFMFKQELDYWCLKRTTKDKLQEILDMRPEKRSNGDAFKTEDILKQYDRMGRLDL